MNESTTKRAKHFTACASLAALGVKLRQQDLFGPIRQTVQIAQKTVKHTPIEKLYAALCRHEWEKTNLFSFKEADMSSIADGSVQIQTSSDVQFATPSWLGES